MKLATFTAQGSTPHLGLIVADGIVDLARYVADLPDTMIELIAASFSALPVPM